MRLKEGKGQFQAPARLPQVIPGPPGHISDPDPKGGLLHRGRKLIPGQGPATFSREVVTILLRVKPFKVDVNVTEQAKARKPPADPQRGP